MLPARSDFDSVGPRRETIAKDSNPYTTERKECPSVHIDAHAHAREDDVSAELHDFVRVQYVQT